MTRPTRAARQKLVAFFFGEVAAAGDAARVKDDFTLRFDLPGLGPRRPRDVFMFAPIASDGWNGKRL